MQFFLAPPPSSDQFYWQCIEYFLAKGMPPDAVSPPLSGNALTPMVIDRVQALVTLRHFSREVAQPLMSQRNTLESIHAWNTETTAKQGQVDDDSTLSEVRTKWMHCLESFFNGRYPSKYLPLAFSAASILSQKKDPQAICDLLLRECFQPFRRDMSDDMFSILSSTLQSRVEKHFQKE